MILIYIGFGTIIGSLAIIGAAMKKGFDNLFDTGAGFEAVGQSVMGCLGILVGIIIALVGVILRH